MFPSVKCNQPLKWMSQTQHTAIMGKKAAITALKRDIEAIEAEL